MILFENLTEVSQKLFHLSGIPAEIPKGFLEIAIKVLLEICRVIPSQIHAEIVSDIPPDFFSEVLPEILQSLKQFSNKSPEGSPKDPLKNLGDTFGVS